jgi:hypothetical protein
LVAQDLGLTVRVGAYGCPVADDALAEEFAALARRVAEGHERAARLRTLAEHVESQTERDERMLAELEAALGRSAQLRIDDLDPRLRGQRLEEIAIAVLRERPEFGAPIHYRDWFALLRHAGHHVAGKDPLATFLAQLNRSTSVERIGQRSGLYRVREAA